MTGNRAKDKGEGSCNLCKGRKEVSATDKKGRRTVVICPACGGGSQGSRGDALTSKPLSPRSGVRIARPKKYLSPYLRRVSRPPAGGGSRLQSARGHSLLPPGSRMGGGDLDYPVPDESREEAAMAPLFTEQAGQDTGEESGIAGIPPEESENWSGELELGEGKALGGLEVSYELPEGMDNPLEVESPLQQPLGEPAQGYEIRYRGNDPLADGVGLYLDYPFGPGPLNYDITDNTGEPDDPLSGL